MAPRSRTLIAALVVSGALASATAVKMAPLQDLMQRDPEQSYPLVRCAAFYQASAEWAGKERLGAEAWAAVDSSIRTLGTAAVLTRIKSGAGDVEHTTEIVLRDIRNIADLYLDRFEGNYAATGHAMADDPLLLNDGPVCKELVEALGQ